SKVPTGLLANVGPELRAALGTVKALLMGSVVPVVVSPAENSVPTRVSLPALSTLQVSTPGVVWAETKRPTPFEKGSARPSKVPFPVGSIHPCPVGPQPAPPIPRAGQY